MLNALERLAALRAQGILTDVEFAQQKAQILGVNGGASICLLNRCVVTRGAS
ncbi:SHOCT domain-containing protein [Ornithinimicrobium sp. INDO-MA30-4]|uniref:SHOCT domain-containing protein n=1 Tax=Ornithinimicrobium sp. INDO-MA30-4 TaxID=2908651 RepID=UPI001F1C35C3|nr:SHOCT domain-containing protein [Ornithinimicrobium sp. INDO-MA30-4]UJH70553.1 SHOCT domain-containing protein [Ornithinimicrobium sp. INDO-MA30-4]